MKKLLTAIALTVALPATTYAQTVAAAPKAGCCAKMKDMAGCKDMAKMDHSKHGMKAGVDPHAGHNMSPTAPPATHSNHQ